MTPADLDYVGAIRDNADALVAAAERAGVDARVPSCPEWTVGDLLAHIGTVHRFATANCERPPDAEFMLSRDAGIEVPGDPAVRPAWVREGASLLVDTLAAHDPNDPCWTWLPPHTVGFWRRRQAHETAMHRVDAELAAGTPEPIDAALAADGIDELLEILPNRPWAPMPPGEGETLHFHCTDVEGEWLVRLGAEGVEITREHAKGDVAIRGPASALLRWMVGRAPADGLPADGLPADGLEVFGDAALSERWRELARF